jgi:hypothetical protein
MKHHDEKTDKPLMTWDDEFTFSCYPGIDCFNACCRDVTILLNPLDVSRLRSKLGISSTEFLKKYTVRLASQITGVPAVALKMNEDEGKKCHFVTEEGCSVYDSRPYSCRMYPLDTEDGIEYTFIVSPDTCHGLREPKKLTVEEWRRDQDLYPYDNIDHELKDVMAAEEVWENKIKDPRMQDMMYMALYDPDRFREFVFNSTFLTKFDVDPEIVEKIKEDDVSLLYFAAQWLRFALFGRRGVLKFDKDFLDKKKKEVFSNKG